ncbi:MAG: YqaA family protein [Gammaproteobacteria bacterium]
MIVDYILLFFSALIAATILPFYSEAFLYWVLQESPSMIIPLLIATTGNVLGACINWWLGREILRFKDRRWFYFNDTQIARAQQGFQRYGKWTLLLSWFPIIGDPLTLIAGMMKVRFRVFLLLVTLGKASRYLVIAWLTL